MSAPTLIIAGFSLPQRARLEYQQTFERIDAGSASRRMSAGNLFTMTRWARWRTTISGGGWVPAPLLSIQTGVPFEVHAVAPIALRPGEQLPPTWQARTDWPESSITDELGVVIRLVYPVLTVKTLTGARLVTGSASPQWELAMEEV